MATNPRHKGVVPEGDMIHGTAALAAYIEVSEETVRRWHVKFRGETHPDFTLPYMTIPTGK